VNRAWTFHEAADIEQFRPIHRRKEIDVIWIGNWGDDERAAELDEFLVQPALALPELRVVAHGVRYPDLALQKLVGANIEYRGYLPNLFSPQAYAESVVTVHIPRRPYCDVLRGIPTIRVFEAMACGIPLISSPWRDEERLFPEGAFIGVATRSEMSDALSRVLRDKDLAQDLIAKGLRAIRARHTCEHRVRQLLSIVEELGGRTMRKTQPDAASTTQLVPQ